MSSSTKFLNATQGDSSNQSAAQDFLNEKLSKNRFTQEQQTRLDENGGSKAFGSDSDKVVTNQEELNAWDAKPEFNEAFYEGGWRSDKDSGEIGWSDTWNEGGNFQQIKGDGKLNKDYEERFNALGSTESDVDDHGQGWKSLRDQGTMGSTEEMKALAAEWEQAGYDVRVQDMEGHNGVVEANIAVRKGQEQKGERPEEEKDLIKHSPEIKQAKERVRSYEDDALSGKTSADIYSGNPGSKYELDLNKGGDGIGSPQVSSAKQATASFLDNKKSQIKNKYQFQAKL